MKRILSIILAIITILSSIGLCTTVFAKQKTVASTEIVKLSSTENSINIKWKKIKKSSGYQIQIATSKNFKKGSKKYSIKKGTATSKTVTKLKSGKIYYAKIRAYKIVNDKKVYSTWSKTKSIKTATEKIKEETCTNNNNHSIMCGNMGKWFNSRNEVKDYVIKKGNALYEQYQNGDITWDEYVEKGGYGYECWTCSYCGKWTGNIKYTQ